MSADPGFTACCAAAYSSDVVALLLGDSYHPGGLALTQRLAAALRIGPGERALDVASGRGTSPLLLAQEHDAQVDGIDAAAANTAAATATAEQLGLADRTCFRTGDSAHLPYDDDAMDVVISECALCTFPDPARAATEMARVLRAGGRLGITDVTLEGPLPEELTGTAARIACLAEARPLSGYRQLLTDAGLQVTITERHDDAIERMIEQIDARLRVLRMTAWDRLHHAGVDPEAAHHGLAAAGRAVADGTIGYALIVAQKPVSAGSPPAAR